MYVAGIDIGSSTTKILVLNQRDTVAARVTETMPDTSEKAESILAEAISGCSLVPKDISYVVATGYGRVNVPFANRTVTEIACHAKGVHFAFPGARTVLDMGGQDCKAIRVDDNGNHQSFIMNDKCAAGTGRFFEVIARTIGIPLSEFGPLSLEAKAPLRISSVCTVFARSEVVRALRKGVPKADIAAGVCEATVDRVVTLLKRVGIEPELVISGGIGRNTGVVQRIEARLGMPARVPPEPQLMGALGAALFAREAVASKCTK
jgi:predicted CoA-substrate-specific enzyme activase